MTEPLKIYFACSIRGEQGGKEEKELIVGTMKGLGHTVLSEVFTGLDITNNQSNAGVAPSDIYRQDMDWVNEADIVVADVSKISTGMGFEMGWKLRGGERVLALCREDRFEPLSNMIKGCTEPTFRLRTWDGAHNPEQLQQVLEEELGRVTHE